MRFRGKGDARLPELEWRKRATQKTLERYRTKAFDWSTGVTCVHFGWAHLRNMGRRPPTLPRFRSPLAAKKALTEGGFGSVTELLDSFLPRIAPAQMLLGDLAVVDGEQGLDCIMVCTGPLALLGWLPEGHGEGMVNYLGDISDVKGAWRV